MMPKSFTLAQNYGHVYVAEEEARDAVEFIHSIFKTIANDLRVQNSPADKLVKLVVTVSVAEE